MLVEVSINSSMALMLYWFYLELSLHPDGITTNLAYFLGTIFAKVL